MTEVLWRQYKSYSGCLVKGDTPVTLPEGDDSHVGRAYLLTTKVETGGRYGSVMSYDGTGMTAGPDQHIAVFPAELASEDWKAEDDQGTLWKLVRRLETVAGSASYQKAYSALSGAMKAQNWYLAQDGSVRYLADGSTKVRDHTILVKAGDLVYGWEIRNTFTPPNGAVPKSGAEWVHASKWAALFHDLTNHPSGFKAQFGYGSEHLVKRTKRRMIRGVSLEQVVYGRDVTSVRKPDASWCAELDLAMCVYHANSVNAPAIAGTAIERATASGLTGRALGARLIYLLGNSTYGKWDDDLPGGRYQRTRDAAKAFGFWPAELFDGPDAVMPKDLSDSPPAVG